jgi:hypothetical protein
MHETLVDSWGDASEVMTRLIGSWSLNRIVEGQGTMQGIAIFTPLDEGSLAYREQGRLKLLNGTGLQAERENSFSECDQGFDDYFKQNPPRLFHEISLSASVGGELCGSARHVCNLDNYQSTYTFLPDGRFVVRHVVSGPRKHYTITTAYARVS